MTDNHLSPLRNYQVGKATIYNTKIHDGKPKLLKAPNEIIIQLGLRFLTLDFYPSQQSLSDDFDYQYSACHNTKCNEVMFDGVAVILLL